MPFLVAIALLAAPAAHAEEVLLIDPSGGIDSFDLQQALLALGTFDAVDVWNSGLSNPTLAHIARYEGVLVLANSWHVDSVGLGETIADYVDAGGVRNRVILCGDDLLKPEPCVNNVQAGANMRLRLNPELHISENIRVMAQLDLLDNLVLGSTPEGYANEPSDGGGSQIRARGGCRSGRFGGTRHFLNDRTTPTPASRAGAAASCGHRRRTASGSSPNRAKSAAL
jgi:hypothetical protein